MKRKIFFSMLCFGLIFCLDVTASEKDTSNITDKSNITVTFYYNEPRAFCSPKTTDVVIEFLHKIKKEFTYEEIEKIASVTPVLNEHPDFVDNEIYEKSLLTDVDSVCVIKNGDTQILRFAYKGFFWKEYMLCNDKLIKYNEVYGDFAKAIIQYLLETESDTME